MKRYLTVGLSALVALTAVALIGLAAFMMLPGETMAELLGLPLVQIEEWRSSLRGIGVTQARSLIGAVGGLAASFLCRQVRLHLFGKKEVVVPTPATEPVVVEVPAAPVPVKETPAQAALRRKGAQLALADTKVQLLEVQLQLQAPREEYAAALIVCTEADGAVKAAQGLLDEAKGAQGKALNSLAEAKKVLEPGERKLAEIEALISDLRKEAGQV